jgi:hypothetical protein
VKCWGSRQRMPVEVCQHNNHTVAWSVLGVRICLGHDYSMGCILRASVTRYGDLLLTSVAAENNWAVDETSRVVRPNAGSDGVALALNSLCTVVVHLVVGYSTRALFFIHDNWFVSLCNSASCHRYRPRDDLLPSVQAAGSAPIWLKQGASPALLSLASYAVHLEG